MKVATAYHECRNSATGLTSSTVVRHVRQFALICECAHACPHTIPRRYNAVGAFGKHDVAWWILTVHEDSNQEVGNRLEQIKGVPQRTVLDRIRNFEIHEAKPHYSLQRTQ